MPTYLNIKSCDTKSLLFYTSMERRERNGLAYKDESGIGLY